MAWLAQTDFPARTIVKESFKDAIGELEPDGYDSVLRSALEAIVFGPDPRGGAFKAQAIQAAAQLHDRLAVLVLGSGEQNRCPRQESTWYESAYDPYENS